MSAAPATIGRSDLTRSEGRASPRMRTAASINATDAPRWFGAIRPAAAAATTAPMANRPLRATSGHRHEIPELLEGLLADELARPKVLDRGEGLALA